MHQNLHQQKRKIVICGATGNQGGAVASHLLQSGSYRVVCLSRNPQSPASARLRLAGADVLSANPSSQEALLSAFAGAYAVFGVKQPR